MKRFRITIVVSLFLIAAQLETIAQKEVKKSFDAKQTLNVSTVSGNCEIKKSVNDKINVRLVYTYPDDCFKYNITESSDNLKVEEDFDGNCKGKSDWKIEVPAGTEIDFNTASGDLVISGVGKKISTNTASGNVSMEQIPGDVNLHTASGDIILQSVTGEVKTNTASGNVKLENIAGQSKINTASGDVIANNCNNGFKVDVASGNITLQNSNGEINLSAASGDVKLAKIKGVLKINTASGNIEAEGIEIAGVSSFHAASGDVDVDLAKSCDYDLTLSAASGNVELEYNGNEIKGYFEFTARQDKGTIVSPIKFDKEEVVEIDGKKYDKKTFTKGSSTPVIKLKTSSGEAKLVK